MFCQIDNDFRDASVYIGYAPVVWKEYSFAGEFPFVCHHNAWLAHRFLVKRGHTQLEWKNGVYRSARARDVRHSWIGCYRGIHPLLILELDSHQLFHAGGYERDSMPEEIGGIAILADPTLVELPDDSTDVSWIITERQNMERFIVAPDYAPQQFDAAFLEKFAVEMDKYESG